MADLIRLDITEQLSGADSLALGLVPLDDGSLAHGGGEAGHVDGGAGHRPATSSGRRRGSSSSCRIEEKAMGQEVSKKNDRIMAVVCEGHSKNCPLRFPQRYRTGTIMLVICFKYLPHPYWYRRYPIIPIVKEPLFS